MRKHVLIWSVLFGAFMVAGCSSANPSLPSGAAAGTAQRIHYARSLSASAVSPDVTYVPYQGGPVIVAPKFYLTFWGYKKAGDPDKVEPLLIAYAKNMGGSSHNNIEVQYYQGASGTKSYITNSTSQFGGSWDDDSAIPNKPTDIQIAAEAANAIKHFGYDSNGVYVVATAHKHSESGFGPHFCAYHSISSYKNKPLIYDNIPYVPDAGKQCGANIIKPPPGESGADEGVTIMAGHEFGEVITDPQPLNDPAWIGPAGEIGDVCVWHGIANDVFGSKKYTAQPMVSDASTSCVQSYSPSSSTQPKP
jgi:hypothetical protein